jgi:pSer/pThr/pTyr-binding forkhead associated (FHA) protein
MSELLLSILRIGFLIASCCLVLTLVSVLRRDVQAPRDGNRLTPARSTKRPSPRPTLRARKTSTQLLIVEGTLTGTAVPLGASAIVIGRAPDATIVLDDDFVSTHHARLTPNGNHWIVEDLGSTNGTWIDQTRVSKPTVLRPGTQLRIGRTSMELSS